VIIIADAHIRNEHNDAAFFNMLAHIEKCSDSVIFLGDIFDLWIGLPRYENQIHRDFCAWCRSQKLYRTIGFIEGNREYFVAFGKKKCFSWCSDTGKAAAGVFFCHGDQINQQDTHYLRFRWAAKNKVIKILLQFIPLGTCLIHHIKRQCEKTNTAFRKHISYEDINCFAEKKFSQGYQTLFVGHFHQEYVYQDSRGNSLHLIPDWSTTGKITHYDESSQKVTHIRWEEIPTLKPR
jgi:UDP-2,3-diacylglucosamine pyrophosphatase LpxH